MRKYVLYTLLLCVSGMFAQQSQSTFGQNRVQYKKFNWKYITTKHFFIYYYFGGTEIAHNAGRIAEKEFEDILSLTGTNPQDKITLIMYNSVEDLQQSNIGLSDFRQLGGQTNLFKTKAEIAFPGNMVDFREQIRKNIGQMLIQVYLYGGRFKEILQSTYLLTLPEWFLPGAAAYIGEGWSPEMHDQIRSMLKKGIKNPDFSNSDEAIVIGHSIWSYIAHEYGPNNVSNIISLTKAFRRVDVAISSVIGMSYKDFLNGWRRFYLEGEEGIESNEENIKTKKKRRIYSDVSFSPSGQMLAYSKNYKGKYKVYVMDLVTGKSEKVFKGGEQLVNQQLNLEYPRLAWQNDGMLGIIYAHKGIVKLKVVDVIGKADFEDKFERFEQVNSFQFSKDGKEILFSGVQKGMADIFLYNLFTKRLENITKDMYDDIDPVFTKDGGIVFSSNRLLDTLHEDYGKYDRIADQYDLFYLEKIDSVGVLKNLTNNSYRKFSAPQFVNDSTLLCKVENFQRIQLYTVSMNTGKATKITDFDQNVLSYDRSKNGAMSMIQYKEGHQQLYVAKQYKLEAKPEGKIERYVFSEKIKEFLEPAQYEELEIPKIYKTDINNLDIEDYVFESDSARIKELRLQKQQDEFDERVFLLGPYSYKKLFGINNIATSLQVDQLRGLGILLEFGMSDLMEDHRVTASIFGLADLRSSSLFGEYKNLKHKFDYTFRYERNTLYVAYDNFLQDYVLNKFSIQVDKPFSFASRVGVFAAFNSAKYSEFRLSFPFPSDTTKNYLQVGTEFVFDNTIVQGPNMLEGTRMKAYYHHYMHSDIDESFHKVALDFRNYQKIHKQMIIATRVAYGRFMGKGKKNFLLGGMDSWPFASYNTEGDDNPLYTDLGYNNTDLLFNDFATNVRGFLYNEKYGNNFALINLEYRLPIVKYLYPGPISSQFLSGLQLVAFLDMGTTWNGNSVLFTRTDVNVNEVDDGGTPPTFTATVKDYSDPLLYGYGFGVRTNFLGYYMKADFAWGVKNSVTQPSTFYLTLGYDF